MSSQDYTSSNNWLLRRRDPVTDQACYNSCREQMSRFPSSMVPFFFSLVCLTLKNFRFTIKVGSEFYTRLIPSETPISRETPVMLFYVQESFTVTWVALSSFLNQCPLNNLNKFNKWVEWCNYFCLPLVPSLRWICIYSPFPASEMKSNIGLFLSYVE